MPMLHAQSTAFDVPDEDLDVKSFLEKFGLETWASEHDTLERLLSIRFCVITIERDYAGPLWMVRIADPHLEADQLRQELRRLLRAGGIEVQRHEPVISRSDRGLALYFHHEGGGPELAGVGVAYAEQRADTLFPGRVTYKVRRWG